MLGAHAPADHEEVRRHALRVQLDGTQILKLKNGERQSVQIAAGSHTLTVRVDGATKAKEGDRMDVRFPLPHLRLFDEAGNRMATVEES